MRHALIIAGGSGTRLWPMSRTALPKQLIPFIHGQSLLQLAMSRIEQLTPPENRFICALDEQRQTILSHIPGLPAANFIGEPAGRDTLNAVGLSAAVIGLRDPNANIAVFTADHVIEPIDSFRQIIETGFALVESQPDALVTFGITPTAAATGYGYLELGAPSGQAFAVSRFREKPDGPTAQSFFSAGPCKYLWNSGMFVWRAATLLECIRRYQPATYDGLTRIATAWDTPQRSAVLAEIYPTLNKISVDFAVMEPASRDPKVRVLAVPMPLTWLDVGSWPTFAKTCPHDEDGNGLATERHLLLDTKGTLVASSDPDHLIATIGCENLIIVHTPDATLICRADRAEEIKKLHAQVGEQFGKGLI